MLDTMISRDIRQTLDHFRRSVDQLFGSFYESGSRPVLSSSGTGTEYTFTPVVEFGWNENELVLRAILPGVPEGSVKVTAQSNRIILEGERKAPESWTSGAYPQIAYGKFYADIPLPPNVNSEQVKCHLHDGVLDIHVPVADEMKPRQIPIQSANSQHAITG